MNSTCLWAGKFRCQKRTIGNQVRNEQEIEKEEQVTQEEGRDIGEEEGDGIQDNNVK